MLARPFGPPSSGAPCDREQIVSNIARTPMSSTPLNEVTSTGQGLSRLDYLKPSPGLVAPCILRGERPLFVRREAALPPHLFWETPAGVCQPDYPLHPPPHRHQAHVQ